MASLKSRFARMITKRVVAAKFESAGKSIPDLRSLTESFIKNQKIPKGTEIWPVLVNDIAAEWVCAPGAQTNTAILYLHGGGFVMGSPATHRELAARVSAATRASILVLDYRLAPEHPFPAAMQDAISAYHWLLDNGSSEKHLAIGGDSAGGGLTLQTLIALRDEGRTLPAAAFFLSPATDWVRFDGKSYRTRANIDPWINEEMCRFIASHYVGNNDPGTPLFYPADIDLSGLPPLCVHVGDHEVLLSDAVRLAEHARECNVHVELKIWPGMWHVFQAYASFVPEARQSIDEIGRFVANRMG